MDILLTEESGWIDLSQGIGRLINAIVAVLGPELSPGSILFSRCKVLFWTFHLVFQKRKMHAFVCKGNWFARPKLKFLQSVIAEISSWQEIPTLLEYVNAFLFATIILILF